MPEDLLENYVSDKSLSKETILKYVDDYSIYSFYIGAELELYTKYSSPLRLGDNDPSFSLYYSKYKQDKILFKDQSTGKYGDIFMFIRELFRTEELPSAKFALLQINNDFKLGLADQEVGAFNPKLLKKAPLKKDPVKISIVAHTEDTKAFKEYWEFLEIPKKILDLFYVKDVRVIQYKKNNSHIAIVTKILTISYEILGHYKVYQPYAERKFKFRNDFLDIYVEGALQLEFMQDFAIITKSTKECMFFRSHFNWECIAGKSENTEINPFFMVNILHKKYKHVFIWLDGDDAGKIAQQRYIDKYSWLEPIVFDSIIEQKDPTDFFEVNKKAGNREYALNYLKNLIKIKL